MSSFRIFIPWPFLHHWPGSSTEALIAWVKELRLNEGWTFYISTVFEDIPAKSHLHFDVLMSHASLFYYMRNFDNTTGQLVDNRGFRIRGSGSLPQEFME